MKPINLKITGVNSFNNKQEINFNDLTKDGLFGIFGDTGTGKSSIIDCITLALYGKISRYNGISGNGDFLNINRNDAEVEFEFSVMDNKVERVYRIKRGFKKSNDKIIAVNTRLQCIDINENDTILVSGVIETNKKIQDIIGLKYEDFTKAVVLPQGKFSEFLLLDNKNKVSMLERIFSLEEYGKKLQENINNKKLIKKSSLESLEVQIQDKNINEDDIVNNKKELDNNNKLVIDLKNNIDKYNKDKKLNEDLISFKEDYNNFKNKIEELVNHKHYYVDFKEKLEKAEAVDVIYSKIIEKEGLGKKIKELEIIVKETRKESDNIIKELEIKREQFEVYKYKKEVDNPSLEKKVLELDNINNILIRKIEVQKDIGITRQNLVNIEEQEAKQDKELDNLFQEKEKIYNLNKELEAFNLGNNLNNDELAVRLKLEINKFNNKNININLDDYNIDDNYINLEYIKKLAINTLVLYKNELIKDIRGLETKINELKTENLNIINALNDLNTQASINQNKEVIQKLASSLRDNNPCPICGSKEHPNVLTPDGILGTIIEGIKTEIELNNNNLKNNEEEIRVIENKINLYNNKLKELDNGVLEGIEDLDINLDLDVEVVGGVLDDRYMYARVIFLRLENKVSDNSLYINNNNQRLNLLENNINENNKIKNNNVLNKEVLKNKIEDRLNELENIINRLDNKKDLKLEEIIKEIENINITIRKNIEDYNLNIELLDKIEKNNNEIGLKLVRVIAEYNANKEMFVKQEEEVEVLINNSDILKIKNEDEIKEYYVSKEKQVFYRNKISSYEEKYFKYKGALDNLENKSIEISNSSGKDIEDIKDVRNIEDIKNRIEELDNNIIGMQNNYNMTLRKIGELESVIKSQEELLNQVVELKKKINKEQEEYNVIEDLASVVKGGAFIEYLANSQLDNIVKDASIRLLDMTQNKYDIKLQEGSFVIKDYLNGGKLRSTRSLSGGELFMTSLCLALALSSKIQLNNKSPLEVFFLDEGFGTLDNHVLDSVMGSLEQLKSNNINVGIITHVEEIKNRIYNKVVISSTENGSVIDIK